MDFCSVLLQAAPAGGGFQIIFLLAIPLIMWFFFMKPQRDQQKKLEQFRQSLRDGDNVITNGGVYGRIKYIKGDKISVEIAKDVVVEVARYALNPVQEDAPTAEKK